MQSPKSLGDLMPRTAGERPVRRLDYLDGVRGLAALYVVVSHAWDTVFTRHGAPGGLWKLSTLWMGGGRYAVTVFIVVSGFSLGLTWWRNGQAWPGGPRDFLARRARRLVPPYLVAIVLCASLAMLLTTRSGTLFDDAVPDRWLGVVSHALGLQDLWWNGPAGSTAFWSLAVELHIYVAFAVCLLVLRRRMPPWIAVYLVLAVLTVVAQVGPHAWLVVKLYSLYPSLYAMFLLGLVAARFATIDTADAAPEFRRWLPRLAGCAAVGLIAFAVCLPTLSASSPVNDLVVGPVAALVLVGLALGRLGWAQAVMRSRVAVWLGHCSYSLYLIHSVLLELTWRLVVRPMGLPAPLQLLGEIAIGVAISVAAARVFYRFVERPFMSRRSRPRDSNRAEASEPGSIAQAMTPAPS